MKNLGMLVLWPEGMNVIKFFFCSVNLSQINLLILIAHIFKDKH